jgi:hypothetical protein
MAMFSVLVTKFSTTHQIGMILPKIFVQVENIYLNNL